MSDRIDHTDHTVDNDHTDERPTLWTGHLVLRGSDPGTSGGFYEKLGMRPVFRTDDFAILELRGGTHLVIHKDPDAPGQPAPFDLMVEDLEATHQAWSSMGVEVSAIVRDERDIHWVFTVTDPDGNTVVVSDSHVVGVV
jgi:catechol 2,3-dioxygenase-like lactoylglutathione lyase family enzyme